MYICLNLFGRKCAVNLQTVLSSPIDNKFCRLHKNRTVKAAHRQHTDTFLLIEKKELKLSLN